MNEGETSMQKGGRDVNVKREYSMLCETGRGIVGEQGWVLDGPKPIFPGRGGKKWEIAIFPSFGRPKLGNTVQNWEILSKTSDFSLSAPNSQSILLRCNMSTLYN